MEHILEKENTENSTETVNVLQIQVVTYIEDAGRRLPGKKDCFKKTLRAAVTVLVVVLGTISVLICRSVFWVLKTWNDLSMEEIVYHLKMPLEGTNGDMIVDYITYCVIFTVFAAFILVTLFVVLRHKEMLNKIAKCLVSVTAATIIVLSINHIWNSLDVSAYVENQNTYSSFIDDNYVDPATVVLNFPEQKRNLIYIFLESMEITYADQKNGGAFESNVIPELTEISENNEDFSGDAMVLNGGYAVTGATWTIGAMFAQTSGLPLVLPIDNNAMNTQNEFFPGVTVLGDILEKEGYRQELLIGSDAVFGGRQLYFEQHGDYEIYDYNYSLKSGEIPEGYHVWWGYEDKKLFANAKTRISELAESDEPFNLTMLTVDTHFENGYVCELCGDEYADDQYSNVMACSSRQVAEFLQWIQEQPFYENTTIVIAGDHPTMDGDYCENIEDDYERKVYTTYINAPVEVENNTYRQYSTFDYFPTTLASLGVNIEGNRLGLGVNLFSSESTLVERYGVHEANRGLSQKSELIENLVSNMNSAEVKISPYDSVKREVVVTVDDIQWNEEITGIKCAVWSDPEQKDLIWYDGIQQSPDSYIITIPFEDFLYRNGTYIIHIYIERGDAMSVLLSSDSVDIIDSVEESLNVQPQPEISTVSAELWTSTYDYRTGKFDVNIQNVFANRGISTFRCAVWAEEDQSDLRWYEAMNVGNGSYSVNVFARDFDYNEALYNIHVYAIDNAGDAILVGILEESIN